jgi:arylsulfatase A-like enzyme
LMIKMPYSLRAGERITHQVRLIDIMPTILEILDMDIPGSFQGESLLRLIEEGKADKIWPAFSEETHWGDELKSVREGCYKFITNDSLDAFELYNLCSDLGEKKDLADAEKEKAREMRRIIIRWMRSNLGRVKKLKGEQLVDLDEKTRENLRSLGYIK